MKFLIRYYKAEPERFRPVDRMIAHTGYLLFARPVIIDAAEDEATLLAIEGRKDRSAVAQVEVETDDEVEPFES